MEPLYTVICLGALCLLALVAFMPRLRIVPQYRRLVLFRLGHHVGERGPGLVALLPFVDRAVSLDLREVTRQVTGVAATTRDRALLTVDLSWSYKIVDPSKSVMSVRDPEASLHDRVVGELRTLLGRLSYGDLLHNPGTVAAELRPVLEASSDGWGLKLTGLDIQDIRKQRTD